MLNLKCVLYNIYKYVCIRLVCLYIISFNLDTGIYGISVRVLCVLVLIVLIDSNFCII